MRSGGAAVNIGAGLPPGQDIRLGKSRPGPNVMTYPCIARRIVR